MTSRQTRQALQDIQLYLKSDNVLVCGLQISHVVKRADGNCLT